MNFKNRINVITKENGALAFIKEAHWDRISGWEFSLAQTEEQEKHGEILGWCAWLGPEDFTVCD